MTPKKRYNKMLNSFFFQNVRVDGKGLTSQHTVENEICLKFFKGLQVIVGQEIPCETSVGLMFRTNLQSYRGIFCINYTVKSTTNV